MNADFQTSGSAGNHEFLSKNQKTTDFLLIDGYIIRVPAMKKNEFLSPIFSIPFSGEVGEKFNRRRIGPPLDKVQFLNFRA
ncbi:MAG: hypothetical protein H6Q44_1514 [Deltaproteobacteria bacterium]|jgi:hypothetical protein|nr:hypothetical protein [Deltaproteobacteria bacterium]